MNSADLDRVLPTFVLYAVNVYEPASKEAILEILGDTKTFSSVDPDRLLKGVERALTALTEEAFLRTANDGRFYVTFQGIKTLSLKKLGFPRDTNRLYYLKLEQQRRGK